MKPEALTIPGFPPHYNVSPSWSLPQAPSPFLFFPVFLFNCLSLCCQFPAHSTGLKSTFILQLLTQTGYCSASFSSPVPPRCPALPSVLIHPFILSDPAQNLPRFLFVWSTIDCFAESWYCVLMFLSTFNKHSHFINGHFSPHACLQHLKCKWNNLHQSQLDRLQHSAHYRWLSMNNDCVTSSKETSSYPFSCYQSRVKENKQMRPWSAETSVFIKLKQLLKS